MKYILIIFFISSCLISNAQSDSLRLLHIDSLFAYLEKEVSNINVSHRFDETFQTAHYALNKAMTEGNPETIAKAHNLLGSFHYFSVRSNNPDSTFYHDKKTLEYLLKTNNQEKIANAYDRVGKDLVSMGRYLEAEEHLYEVLSIYESLEQPINIGKAYASLNYLFRETKDYEQALLYGEKSLELFEANYEDENELIQPYLGLIKTYPYVGRAQDALKLAQETVQIITRRFNGADNINMANVRAWRGEVHIELKEYDKAMEDYWYSWNVIKTVSKRKKKQMDGKDI